MKKILRYLVTLLTLIFTSSAWFANTEESTLWNEDIKNWMLWTDASLSIIQIDDTTWTWSISGVFLYAIDFIFQLLIILLTWIFILIWWKLAISRWNPEEFKKAMLWFIYAIIWAALIPASYAVIQIISWISL